MSAVRRPVTGPGKRALVALAMGAITSPLLVLGAGPASAAVDLTTACPADQVEDPGFSDIGGVPEQFRLAINCLATLGITTGQTSTTFNPAGSITRVQMAQFLFRLGEAAGGEWDTSDAGFMDVAGVSAEGQAAINALFNAGVVNGKTETTFDPLSSVTRAQMATFIAQFYENVLGAPLPGTVDDAFDDDENSVHEQNINAVAAADIADGFSAEMYGPERPVTRGQMAAFVARTIQVAINEDLIPPLFGTDEPEVTVTNTNVTAGGDVVGAFGNLPENATVTVSGAGLTNQTVTVGANGAFTLGLPANAPTGPATLTFVITMEDGEQVEVTAAITVAAPPSITARPDLLGAAVVRTVTQTQVEPGNPAGTTVRFTFDEDVTVLGDTTVGQTAGSFTVVLNDGTAQTNGVYAAAPSGASVDILFPGVDTTTGAGSAEELTLATVDFGAVRDASGLTNPEYDATLGTSTGGGTVTLPAGITDGPDLVGVGGFRQGSTAGTTAVDLTFDEAAFVTAAAGADFLLIPANGEAPIAATGTPTPYVQGSASVPSGGTVAGGNGTATLTVVFPTPGSASDRPPISAASIARAVVEADTVSDAPQTSDLGIEAGNANVLQAVQGQGQRTTDPDLVSVTLVPSTTGGQDGAVFTFDEAIDPSTVTTLSGFTLYNADGTAATLGTAGQVNAQNPSQVLVTVTSGGGVSNVVGGSVAAGAVQTPVVAPTQTNPGSPARANEADEQGMANSVAGAGRVAGRTAAPELTGVAINRAASPFPGSTGALQVTYAFDTDVTLPGNSAANANEFLLYLADGTRVRGTAIATAARAEEVDNTVTVTAFEVLLADNTVRSAAITEAELESAVLGTVAETAVAAETGGATNFPAAERTSGGNGTPQ